MARSTGNYFLLGGLVFWVVALACTIFFRDGPVIDGSTSSSNTIENVHIIQLEGMSKSHQKQQHDHRYDEQQQQLPKKVEQNSMKKEIKMAQFEREGKPPSVWYTQDAMDDMITALPGLDFDPGFKQFSGYLDGSSSTRHLFYWYVESQSDPVNDPVVLWTNGGPGCSGLLGFGTEHGPFRIDGDGNLTMNPYSWNRIANMLYIEQPAGVGFSYFDTKADKYTGDDQSAKDNYYFILNFLHRFPERRSNSFYISSESYGGHYMPQLAMYILKNDFFHTQINFKGFMVGNPYVDPYTNTITQIRAYYNHGLIAKPLFDKWVTLCENPMSYDNDECYKIQQDMFDQFGPGINPYALDYPVCFENPFLAGETYEFDLHPDEANSTSIRSSTSKSTKSISRMSQTNQAARIYEYRRRNRMNRKGKKLLQQDKNHRQLRKHGNRHRHHHHDGTKGLYDDDDFAVDDDFNSIDFDDEFFHNEDDTSSRVVVPRTYSAQVDEFLYRNNVTNIVAPSFLPEADNTYKPCSQVHLERFLNKHKVRAALHVKDEGGFLWSACTDDIVYSDRDFDKSVINEYKEIIKMAIARSPDGSWINDLNILVFSGDDDSIASTAGTQTWIWDLGIPPVSHDEWKAWIVDGQTAGFVVHFKLLGDSKSSFIFATVHGAGHEVPAYRPYEALELFARYLDRTL